MDKGTNELRIRVTDFANNVIRMRVGTDPSLSMNSLVGKIIEDWALNYVIELCQQRDNSILSIERLKVYGVDAEEVRKAAGI